METEVVLVTDKIYIKTRRYLEKIRACTGGGTSVTLAQVSGFSAGLPINSVSDCVSDAMDGSVTDLSDRIRTRLKDKSSSVSILALNESAILPAIAIRRLLGISSATGYLESCDKRRTRSLLLPLGGDL